MICYEERLSESKEKYDNGKFRKIINLSISIKFESVHDIFKCKSMLNMIHIVHRGKELSGFQISWISEKNSIW